MTVVRIPKGFLEAELPSGKTLPSCTLPRLFKFEAIEQDKIQWKVVRFCSFVCHRRLGFIPRTVDVWFFEAVMMKCIESVWQFPNNHSSHMFPLFPLHHQHKPMICASFF